MNDRAHRNLLPPVDADDAMEQAVLFSLLIEHPTQLTMTDLYRERREPDDPVERDAVDRAVQRLVAAGLLLRNGPVVIPSRAALRSEELHSL
jgi:hypothetical protein